MLLRETFCIRAIIVSHIVTLCDMGHCIATLCKGNDGVKYEEDADDKNVLLSDTEPYTVNPGLDANKRVDAIIPQGYEGAHAMDTFVYNVNLELDCTFVWLTPF